MGIFCFLGLFFFWFGVLWCFFGLLFSGGFVVLGFFFLFLAVNVHFACRHDAVPVSECTQWSAKIKIASHA